MNETNAIHFAPGTSIKRAAYQMLAAMRDRPVTATFNDIPLRADENTTPEDIIKQYETEMERKREEYRNSPQYAIDREKEEQRRSSMQMLYAMQTNEIMRWTDEDWSDLTKVLDWLVAIQPATDHVGVETDPNFIVNLFDQHGYKTGVNTGEDFREEDKENYARYIVGQCMSCLKSIGAIHQVTYSFVERWKAKFEDKPHKHRKPV